MKKRILGLILTLAMVLSCMPIIAYAETSGTCGENLTWTLDDEGTLTISGTGDMTNYLNGTAPWAYNRPNITEIIIEDDVTGIGKWAFFKCDNLKTVRIPQSVNKIGEYAFGSCKNLTDVYISDLAAWCNIDFGKYDGNPLCSKGNLYINNELATDIVIPQGMEKIKDYAFNRCQSIKSVNMPDGVKEIGESAFEFCKNLQSVSIPESVESIAEYAFCGSGLKDIRISASVSSIEYSTFLWCGELESVEVDAYNASYMSVDGVLFNKDKTEIIRYPSKKNGTSYTIPESVTSIGDDAFEGSELLERVDIPDSVNEIGYSAFKECINLTSLRIPEGVKVINYGMVLDCEKLASINIPESVDSISWGVFDGTAYYNDESNWTDNTLYIDNCFIDSTSELSGEYQVKDGTRVIAGGAMYTANGVTKIIIPESVISIGDLAFDGTKYYKDASNWTDHLLYIDDCLIEMGSKASGEYRIKDGTRLIAEDAFFLADEVTSITVPSSVKHIGDNAFGWLASWSVGLDVFFEAPAAVKIGGEKPFSEMVKSINIHEGYTGYTEENGYPADKIVVEPHSYENGKCSVCGAARIAASGTCGENLTWTLDDEGTLTISGTGDMTDFEHYDDAPWEKEKTAITKVVIEDGVTSIGDHAFEYQDNLERITIPQSVNKIGEDAIYSCDNLLSIEVDENNEAYMSDDGILFNKAKTLIVCYPAKKENTSYEIPDSVTCIEWGAFSECKNLESIHIPDSVKEIGGFAFEECSNLTSLTIPDGVTTINYGMAVECEKLASIKFPDSINSIACYVIDGTAYYNDPSNWKDDVLFVDKCLMEAKRDAQLGNYQIPDGTLTIADEAFYTCEGLTGVSIPESVTSIGMDAFEETAYYNDDANWTDNALYIDNCLVGTKKALSGDYQIKDGTRLIAACAFYWAKDITGITIPKSVTRIGYEAFHICDRQIDLIFKAPNAVKLYRNIFIDGSTFSENVNKIYIHEGYAGYTEENGYPADKIVVEPHNYKDGVCSICGERETVPPVERIDESGDAKYAFRVNLEQAYENSYVYAAVYDADGVLVSVNRVPLEMTGDTVISLDKSENDTTAKVFVWTDELKPILETAEEFPLIN